MNIHFLDLDNTNHLQQITDIINSRDSLMRIPAAGKALEKINNFKNNKHILFGCFEGDILLSFISVGQWAALPYYTISNFYLRAGTLKYFSVKDSGMAALFTAAIEHMESKEYYTFYFTRAEEHWPIKNKKRGNMKFEESCPAYARYIRTLEEIIEPNCISKFSAHRSFLGDTSVSIKSAIIRCTLPNELRAVNYEF